MSIRPKKRLGQNFLIDPNIQRKIIAACRIQPTDNVLEIGSGRGELTKLIAQKTQNLIAVELDTQLCPVLKDILLEFPKVKIVNQDILSFNLERQFKSASKIKVVGNLPYYITTPIIVHLLKFRDKISSILITVQKEFAERMVATCGDSQWGSFSCFLQYYTKPSKSFIIKKTCFWPQPKVDSALIKLDIKDKLPLDAKSEKQLFKIIRASFQQRRKTLRKTLSGIVSSSRLARYFECYQINKDIRGEKLSVEDFINLVNFK